eukprot:GHUV01036266.1.p1 GENE.GHUV01036266.1~~GHUV01036266.1.p1  ORF type:complete len:121 (-),score=22.26 GHUV01036266.1:254-616(-)
MSGRAGRRGKDDHGTVIVCVDETLDSDTCKGIVQGKPSPLLSSFRLSYYTLLNLMKRVEGGTHDLEYVIANSFQQFQQEQAMPKVRHYSRCHLSALVPRWWVLTGGSIVLTASTRHSRNR